MIIDTIIFEINREGRGYKNSSFYEIAVFYGFVKCQNTFDGSQIHFLAKRNSLSL